MGIAQVRGYQGDNLASPTSLLATAKHFAAYGGAEAGRDYNTVSLSERDLWDIYLPPFEAVERAGVGTFMASFNEINGTPAHANEWLLTRVLRDRWGFRGLVVSDWTGVWELMNHGIGDSTTVAKRALRAGVDMEMSSTLYRDHLAAEIRAGRFPQAVVDTAVHRVLRAKATIGLFDDPYRGISVDRERTQVLTPENRAAAREIAREAVVLLTNKNVAGAPALPLKKNIKLLAVIGGLANDQASGMGPWSGAGRAEDVVTILSALRRALPQTLIGYAPGVPLDTVVVQGAAARTDAVAEAEQLARTADAVVLVLGERGDMSGEAASRTSIELPGAQLQLAQAVVRAARTSNFDKPVIAVLMNGRPLAVQWLADSTSAMMTSWFLGVEHGNAVADILLGDAAPSGKLPVTFPRTTGQVPIYYNHKNTGRPGIDRQKYTSNYIDSPLSPLFPFGHGLSYTTFDYRNLRVSSDSIRGGDSVTVSVDLVNTGARAGTEVAQLYLRDDVATVTRPVRELRGFQRVTLNPGESRTLRFVLRREDLALYDRDMNRVVEPGWFTVWAGGSSAATLSGKFKVVGEPVTIAPAPPVLR